MSRESGSPYSHGSLQDKAWVEGWRQGVAQCNHHPEAMTYAAVNDMTNTLRITQHQMGVKAGRELERDLIGEQLILIAQEYGHAQFVFTREQLETLQDQANQVIWTLGDIETLRH